MLFNVKELYGLLGLKKVPLKKRESCMITGFSLFMMPEQSGKLILFFDLQMVFVCNAAILVFQFGYWGFMGIRCPFAHVRAYAIRPYRK